MCYPSSFIRRVSFSSRSVFDLSKPFTRNSLAYIHQSLQDSLLPTTVPLDHSGHAAVLVPFCNVKNVPSILFELRGSKLRSHSGEVSFPGGRVDQTDNSYLDAALRETHEELGIPPFCIEILGELGPPEVNLRGDMAVWPFVGFVHASKPSCSQSSSSDEPLESIDLTCIQHQISQHEVDQVFPVPLSALTDPARMRRSMFRGQQAYWTINVGDIVYPGAVLKTASICQADDSELGRGKDGAIEVWGLTGWYLNLLMQALHVYRT